MVELRSKFGAFPNSITAIDLPNEDSIRARKVVTRSRSRPTGKYPSWKMGRMIQWESHNELNAYRLLDANPAVLAFHEQPLVIRYQLDGVEHIHYPDTLVDFGSSRELWEIKSASEATKPEIVSRTKLMTEALPNHGFEYRMVLGDELARKPRLSTVLAILKYGRQPIGMCERELVRRILETNGEISWEAALKGDLGPLGRQLLSRLMLEGVIQLDIEQPLSAQSRFLPCSCAKGA